MGVYIKGMDKPKECYLCDVWSLCWNEKPYWSEREDCPLIEVKIPHGRLIDADELWEHIGRDRLDSRELIMKMVDKALTVIEAEVK